MSEEFHNRIPAEHAICRLHSISLCVEAPERTARLLTETFDYQLIGEEPSRQRFRIRTGGSAGIVDIQCNPELMRGRMGAGTVHHVAFRARDDAEQLKWRESILALESPVESYLRSLPTRPVSPSMSRLRRWELH